MPSGIVTNNNRKVKKWNVLRMVIPQILVRNNVYFLFSVDSPTSSAKVTDRWENKSLIAMVTYKISSNLVFYREKPIHSY